jgi:SAM-dependent methyltransferase
VICYGCCVGPTTHFEELARPALSRVLGPQDTVLTARDSTSITSAYNGFIDEAGAMTDVEALVLLHDDVVLLDRNFAPRVRRVLRDPTVGVVGIVGASGLCSMSFWEGRTTKGRVWDGSRFLDFGPPRGDVDVVDGLLMVLSPAALETVRFDETTFDGFHGYDADYCLSCRQAGLRVVVEPFVLYHKSTGNMASPAHAAAEAAFVGKWAGSLSRPSPLARLLPDNARRSELRRTTREARLTVEKELDQAQRKAEAKLQGARQKLMRRLGIITPPSSKTGAVTPSGANLEGDPTAPSYQQCPVCRQPMKVTPGELPLVSCEGCQVLGTWPPPSVDDSSSEIFELSYAGERLSRRKQWIYEARQRLAWIETWAADGVLLEIGSATGEFVEEATAIGYEAIGVEPSKWATDIARRSGSEVFCGSLTDWRAEYAGFTVDAIAMFHVLEHLEDPVEVLEECRSVLADDGRLFIEVPNGWSRAAKSLDPTWDPWQFGFHYWHYTPPALQVLLERAGLQILELREVTARVYNTRAAWGLSKAKDLSAGHSTPNLDYLRVVAGRDGTVLSTRG